MVQQAGVEEDERINYSISDGRLAVIHIRFCDLERGDLTDCESSISPIWPTDQPLKRRLHIKL